MNPYTSFGLGVLVGAGGLAFALIVIALMADRRRDEAAVRRALDSIGLPYKLEPSWWRSFRST